MIADVHCHLLPAMDDGAKNVSESVAILKTLQQQSVEAVVATPHFHSEERVDDFLLRRQKAEVQLRDADDAAQASIYLGAEVRYERGISNLDGLEKLTLGHSG